MNKLYPSTQLKTFDAPTDHPDFDISRFEWAKLHLHSLTKKRFFGKAIFILEDGKIVRLIKEEIIKP